MTERVKFEKKSFAEYETRCDTCFHWQNLPDIEYNKVHDGVKKCGGGSIVSAKTMCCNKHKAMKTIE